MVDSWWKEEGKRLAAKRHKKRKTSRKRFGNISAASPAVDQKVVQASVRSSEYSERTEVLDYFWLQPFFPAEPGFLALRVLAGGRVDEFLAGRAVDLAVEERSDFAEADGFLTVVGNFCQCGDFLQRAPIEHSSGAEGDAGVEISTCALDDEAAEL